MRGALPLFNTACLCSTAYRWCTVLLGWRCVWRRYGGGEGWLISIEMQFFEDFHMQFHNYYIFGSHMIESYSYPELSGSVPADLWHSACILVLEFRWKKSNAGCLNLEGSAEAHHFTRDMWLKATYSFGVKSSCFFFLPLYSYFHALSFRSILLEMPLLQFLWKVSWLTGETPSIWWIHHLWSPCNLV